MRLSVVGSTARVHGAVDVPNSKYHAHRALILASLAPGTSRISGMSDARHVRYTVSLLRSLGIRIDHEDDAFVVHGRRYHARHETISAGSSGSTLYFMVGLAALADAPLTVTAQKYFRRRPIGPLLQALRDLGLDVSSATDCPPIRVGAGRPRGGRVHIDGMLSQWISALLLVAPFASEPTEIVVDGPLNERTYIDLTIRMMARFGLTVTAAADGRRYRIEPGQSARPTNLRLPPDIGSAAFGLAVAALRPSDVLLRGLTRAGSDGVDHPEAGFLDVLGEMGVPMSVDREAGGLRIQHDGVRLRPVDIDCRAMPDMLPILATLTCRADGDSVLRNVEHVRLKESDRVVSMLQLNEMGGLLRLDGGDLHVRGVDSLRSAHLSSFNDHRVLMSLSVAAAAAEGRSTLTFPTAYRISYPQFLEAMQTLHVDMEVEPDLADPGGRRRPARVSGAVENEENAARVTGPEWVRRWAREKPHALAVVDVAGDRTDHVSWRELDAEGDAAAAVLLGLGVRPGDRVAVQLPNRREFVVAALGAMRIGAVICPIMPIFRQREVADALARTGARVLIVIDNYRGRQHDREVAEILEGEQGGALPLRHVLVLHGTPGTGHVLPRCGHPGVTWQPWHREMAVARPDRAAIDDVAPHPADPAQLLLTSGTSGEPKGVVHRHGTLSRAAWMEVEHLRLNSSDSIFVPSPLAHQTGFLYGMWLAFTLGVPQILQATWDPERALRALNDWDGTFVQAATPFLSDLVHEVETGGPRPRALRIFVATGAAVPRALAERATRVLGAGVCGAFGTTETGLATLGSPDDPAARAWGTDGRALAGIGIRVVDDGGRRVSAGVEGHFELSSPTVFDGYLDRPDLTAEVIAADGWYRTGDLATIDADGYLRITGRVRDVVNRGGEKIPVSEIEQLLHTLEGVEEVAIVAMPDARLGERACAFVVPAAGARVTFRTMQRFLDDARVAKQYWPERLEVVEELPRNAVGKVQKFRLREEAAQFTHQRFEMLTSPVKENEDDGSDVNDGAPGPRRAGRADRPTRVRADSRAGDRLGGWPR
ncbi:3-phosphoshikimate 1-carboxyvinyltransferase [Pseudactinotalea sp. HY160]|uniref:3-phosphoshikimate 1-carboxyvinyltransferase n=1 Tax=Pseudactinotalea sp. HY160 TaxID=2654490 RepID=UPI00128BED3B|nr:3-phosphoshikimate 1-carboxyvinyltransferase [Pseudactinotalea sp. HY160]MPV48759.1 3-phosphoshikimate 1-carboxyvinyltransferase [Pseudactinotalea sp. HY160]